MKEFFEGKLNNLENMINDKSISIEQLKNEYTALLNSIEIIKSGKKDLVPDDLYQELVSKLDSYKDAISELEKAPSAAADNADPNLSDENMADVGPEDKEWSTKKTLATVGTVLTGAAVLGGILGASGCFGEKTEQDTNENKNENLTDLEKVSSTLSTFINSGLNNGVELTTDEGLMLMYASNIETRIDLGDNVTLDQVVLAHYIDLAEDLIANNPEYKGKLVSDVAPELMTNDYHAGLGKINDAFIKYGYIAPTSLLIANENDKKVLSNLEEALKEGIKNNGDFSRANELAVESYKENTSILSGTQIIMAGQYSAINAYGQNAGVEITGMDKETFDLIFRECGGSVVNTGYEAYTTYMTIVRSTLKVDILRQISEWNVYTITNKNIEELANQKYEEIDKFVKANKVKLVTPENVNKERLEQMKKDNEESAKGLNDRLDAGYILENDKDGNQILVKPVSPSEKAEIEKNDKEQAEKDSVIKYDDGYKENSKGEVVDSEGNNLGKPSVGEKPVPDAPTMTPDEVGETEKEANDLLKENGGVISEEFIPIGVEETESKSNQQHIDELNALKGELNETVVTDEFNPFEDVVTFTPSPEYAEYVGNVDVEGIGENGVMPGFGFNENGELVKLDDVKKR